MNKRRKRTLCLEWLETRLTPASTRVNTVVDAVTPADDKLSLEEAIQFINGDLPYESLSAKEKQQVSDEKDFTDNTIVFHIGSGEQAIYIVGTH